MTIHANKLLLVVVVCGSIAARANVVGADEPAGPALAAEQPLAERQTFEAIAPGESVSETRTETADSDRASGANSWRYKHHDGRWWYWLPSERWVMWQDGRWIDPPTYSLEDPTTGAGVPGFAAPATQYPSGAANAPSYSYRRQPVLAPRPRDWYYTGRAYDGPYYYYDEFYRPYSGFRPDMNYPVPRPYSGGYAPGQYYPSGPGYYNRPAYGGFSIGGGSGVRIGIGF